MATIDTFLPEPRLTEINTIDLPLPPEAAFAAARSFDLARVPLAAFLFWLRTLPERLGSNADRSAPHLRLDEIGRSGAGFHVLADEPDRLIVGAIGKFWQPHMAFRDVPADRFASFEEGGWGKIVWELRAEPREDGTRLVFELRLCGTDDEAYRAFRRYYRLIAPFSQFFRRHALRLIRADVDRTEPRDVSRPLAGDLLIAQPKAQATDEIVIDADPSAVWPWLVQMGCHRAGWYSHDDLDNAGVRSAIELVPELQRIAVGDVLPATPDGDDGFTVLVVEPERTLVLGALIDTAREAPLFFDDAKPPSYFQSTWTFVLEPLEHARTRLIVRARVDYAPDALAQRASTRVLGLVHHFMETAQLQHLKERVEGRAPRVHSSWHDVGASVAGAALILLDFATPFLRGARSHWGLTAEDAARPHPGDEHIPYPLWQWTHAVKVKAPRERVWPWIAQVGQSKAGFYSYQVLENIAGCNIQNADRVHAEWQATKVGDPLTLHPSAPPLTITRCEPNTALVAAAGIDGATGTFTRDALDRPGFVAVSWAFLLEPTADGGALLKSRYRCACSADLATRLQLGPTLVEPVGFAMDRRMLRGIKARAEA